MRTNILMIGTAWLMCLMSILCLPGIAAEDSRITAFTQKCREANWDDATIQTMEELLGEAMSSDLDVELLALRLQEGLAKKADPKAVVQAVASRLGVMQHSRALTQEHGCTSPRLEQTVGAALEAGMSAEAIESLLSNGNNQRPGQLIALLDAGRTLVASGWEEKAAVGLATDFRERNLRRSEMIRAVRVLVGMGPANASDLPTVRTRLWGRGRSAANAAAGGGRGMGNGNGAGSRADRTGRQGGAGNGRNQ